MTWSLSDAFHDMLWLTIHFPGPSLNHFTYRNVFYVCHTLSAIIELTMSFPFSFNALTAFFLETFA